MNQEIPKGIMIQKDGSYAITVEVPGGIISTELLELFARISKEKKALIHPTTAQKMMILNLDLKTAKEVLNELESFGAVVRKARDISTARVCVGTPYCKLAFQDTFSLSKALFKETARILTAPKFKIAIAGCPACCSWANSVDLGFVGVRSGYKVFIGGHGGVRPTAGIEITTIKTHDEAILILKKAVAIFNETVKRRARFDRVIKKIGLDEIKRRLGVN